MVLCNSPELHPHMIALIDSMVRDGELVGTELEQIKVVNVSPDRLNTILDYIKNGRFLGYTIEEGFVVSQLIKHNLVLKDSIDMKREIIANLEHQAFFDNVQHKIVGTLTDSRDFVKHLLSNHLSEKDRNILKGASVDATLNLLKNKVSEILTAEEDATGVQHMIKATLSAGLGVDMIGVDVLGLVGKMLLAGVADGLFSSTPGGRTMLADYYKLKGKPAPECFVDDDCLTLSLNDIEHYRGKVVCNNHINGAAIAKAAAVVTSVVTATVFPPAGVLALLLPMINMGAGEASGMLGNIVFGAGGNFQCSLPYPLGSECIRDTDCESNFCYGTAFDGYHKRGICTCHPESLPGEGGCEGGVNGDGIEISANSICLVPNKKFDFTGFHWSPPKCVDISGQAPLISPIELVAKVSVYSQMSARLDAASHFGGEAGDITVAHSTGREKGMRLRDYSSGIKDLSTRKLLI
jgi:hypothetical protein